MKTPIHNPLPMRQPLQTTFADTTVPGTSLQSLINHLLRHSLNDILRSSSSSVMNEIPDGLSLLADKSRITPIIEELLQTVLLNARKGRIHIRADRFRDIVILEVQDKSNYNGYALECSIKSLEPLARMIGGYIGINGKQQLDTTITFSFPNLPGMQGYDC